MCLDRLKAVDFNNIFSWNVWAGGTCERVRSEAK